MRKLFTRKTDYLIALFIVGAVLMLAFCEDADADWSAEFWHDSTASISDFNDGFDNIGARYTFDSGASFYGAPILGVGGDVDLGSFLLGFAETFDERWQAQLQLAYFEDEPYGGIAVRRYIGDGPFKLALGASYWINGSPGSDSDVTFNLGFGYHFDSR